MMEFLSVCLGGAIGSGARFLLTAWIARTEATPAEFPLGTLTVNVVGSFCLAFVIAISTHGALHPTLRLALSVGVLGGFTTYSTFSCETLAGLQQGYVWTTALYVAATVLGCLAACVLGQLAGNRLAA
jgi:CrcB protein